MRTNEAEKLVDSTIDEFVGEVPGQRAYLIHHRREYVRTITDVVGSCPPEAGRFVLELGAFFGLVSVCLSKLGYRVVALDSPEYVSDQKQCERYARYGVTATGMRLQEYVLPFGDETFDVVVMCEVLEHLNFNPLPLIKEINRIGRMGSLFYLSTPNLASLRNRYSLLTGKSILQSIQIMFDQLDPDSPLVANDHWREYTMSDVRQMLTRLGYRIECHYYFDRRDGARDSGLRAWIIRAVHRAWPSTRENQTALAIREQRTAVRFDIPKTVHPTLGSL